MKTRKRLKTRIFAFLSVALVLAMFTVCAFADDGEFYPDYSPVDTRQSISIFTSAERLTRYPASNELREMLLSNYSNLMTSVDNEASNSTYSDSFYDNTSFFEGPGSFYTNTIHSPLSAYSVDTHTSKLTFGYNAYSGDSMLGFYKCYFLNTVLGDFYLKPFNAVSGTTWRGFKIQLHSDFNSTNTNECFNVEYGYKIEISYALYGDLELRSHTIENVRYYDGNNYPANTVSDVITAKDIFDSIGGDISEIGCYINGITIQSYILLANSTGVFDTELSTNYEIEQEFILDNDVTSSYFRDKDLSALINISDVEVIDGYVYLNGVKLDYDVYKHLVDFVVSPDGTVTIDGVVTNQTLHFYERDGWLYVNGTRLNYQVESHDGDVMRFTLDWLGNAISGILKVEFVPAITFGTLLTVIIAFGVVMWWLKVYGGG